MVQEFKGKDPGKRLVVNTVLAGACKRIFFLFFDPGTFELLNRF